MTISRMSEEEKDLVRAVYNKHRARKAEINAQIRCLRNEKRELNKCTGLAALAVMFEEPIVYIKRIVSEGELV